MSDLLTAPLILMSALITAAAGLIPKMVAIALAICFLAVVVIFVVLIAVIKRMEKYRHG